MNDIYKNRASKPYFFYVCLFGSTLFLIVFYLLSYFNLIQDQNTVNLIGSVSRWCERISDGIFREPVNTISNLGFILVGLYISLVLSKDASTNSSNHFIGINNISIIYTIAVIFLGPGAILMHATNTEWGNWIDNLSMIMFIIIPWLYNISLMNGHAIKNFTYIYIMLISLYAIFRGLYGWELGINLNVFGVSIGLWIISEFLYAFWSPLMRFLSGFIGFFVMMLFGMNLLDIYNNFAEFWWILLFWLPGILANNKPATKRSYKWFVCGVISYYAAFSIWLTGVDNHPLCNPDSLFQAHGIWHLLSALACLFFFYHYRSQTLIK